MSALFPRPSEWTILSCRTTLWFFSEMKNKFRSMETIGWTDCSGNAMAISGESWPGFSTLKTSQVASITGTGSCHVFVLWRFWWNLWSEMWLQVLEVLIRTWKEFVGSYIWIWTPSLQILQNHWVLLRRHGMTMIWCSTNASIMVKSPRATMQSEFLRLQPISCAAGSRRWEWNLPCRFSIKSHINLWTKSPNVDKPKKK